MMHPFFRYGLGNSSQSSQFKKDGPSRSKSPTGSYEEEEEECNEGNSDRRISIPQSLSQRLDAVGDLKSLPIPHKKNISVPVIKVDDKVVFSAKASSKDCSNENRKRLGPNKNNIILETLQNELKGKK